jgi:predicted methyltransferase
MRRSRSACVSLLVIGLLTVGCTAGSEPPAEPAATAEPEPLSVLDHPARSEDDHYRDAGFKPLEVYGFFDIGPGMTVGDLWPGGGYNTAILAQLVGDTGRVVAILSPAPAEPDRAARSLERFSGRLDPYGFTNLEIAADPTQVPEDTFDVLLTVRNYHDLGEAPDRLAALPAFMRVLKPGGIFAVVDAQTDKPDERDEPVHRINDELSRREITSAGFEFIEASDVLVNTADTYDFDGRERAGEDPVAWRTTGEEADAPIHRYYLHRFVHKYRKPMQ